MKTSKGYHPSSYSLTPMARKILEEAKEVLGRSRTAIVEEALLEWAVTHLTPQVHALYRELLSHPPALPRPKRR